MLNLLVADDERIMRDSICYLIHWEDLGIHLVASCKNGLEAYEQAEKLKPDIILPDIKMPGMSGLELVEKLYSPDRALEFILLTGYADFSYAHKALTYHVHHYLLKPCNEQQIIQAVQQAAQSVYMRRQMLHTEPAGAASAAQKNYSPNVQKVIEYLETHYMDSSLSLKNIAANYLFMNPDYLGRQFLQQTGYRFVDYLLNLRIHKAQWLLVNHVLPNEVAEKVGYGNNPQYFAHLFSKATGLTLREYAKALYTNP